MSDDYDDDDEEDLEDDLEEDLEEQEGSFPEREGLRWWDSDWSEDHDSEALALTAHGLLHRKFEKGRHTKAFREALEAGETLEDAFGKKAKNIALADIRRVRHIASDEEVRLEYRGHDAKGKVVIGGGDDDPHAEVFAVLIARIAPGMQPMETRLSTWEAARAPLLYLAITLAGGGLLAVVYWVYENDEDGPSGLKGKLLYWIADLLGWWGIAGITGAIALAIVAWLVSRLRNPPVAVEIRIP